MSLDSLSLALTQIQYLVNSLNKKNFLQSKNCIEELVAIYGSEAERHLLCCCLAGVDFSGSASENSTSIKGSSLSKEKDKEQLQLLTEYFGPHITQPAFSSLLSSAFEHPLKSNNSKSVQLHPRNISILVTNFCRYLRLNRSQEVVLRISLLENLSADARSQFLLIVRQKLTDLFKNFTDQDRSTVPLEGGIQESSPEVVHNILYNLLNKSILFDTNGELLEEVLNCLRRDYPRELVPIILAPILYQQEQEIDYTSQKMAHEGINNLTKNIVETSLADLILETGYSFTASVEECRTNFAAFGLREISSASVARAVSFMSCTHTGLDENSLRQLRNGTSPAWHEQESVGEKNNDGTPSTWNMDIFVQVLMELNPSLSWKEVISELDFPGFIVRDKTGLRTLLTALQLGIQGQGATFPADIFYHSWDNVEGQLSLLSHLIKNPDLFCIADYPHHPINVEILKSPPEPDNKKLANWKCLGLLETLLNLLENGGLYSQVQELLKEPVQQCPDVLVLGLLQLTQPMTKLRQELLSSLIPVFLGNHPNSAIILHHAWHAQSPLIKPLVMHAMAEWYMRAEHDQTRLSRILDVAQDLKALSMLLNVQRFPFVIDLSCLASRREYLKLDKWLTDKMREHGETFVSACVNFLHQRCPHTPDPPIPWASTSVTSTPSWRATSAAS